MSHLTLQVFGQKNNLTARDLDNFEKDLAVLTTPGSRLDLFDLIARAKQLVETIAFWEMEEASKKLEELSVQEQKSQPSGCILNLMKSTNTDFIQRARNDLAYFNAYLKSKRICVQ